MHRTSPLFAAAVATAMVLIVPTSALAQDSIFEVSSRVVRYDDLNLANDSGRARLEARVRRAAEAVCDFWQARSLAEKSAAQKCRADALAQTQPKIAAAVRNAGAQFAARDRD